MSTQKILLDYDNSWNSPKLFKKEQTKKNTHGLYDRNYMMRWVYNKLNLIQTFCLFYAYDQL